MIDKYATSSISVSIHLLSLLAMGALSCSDFLLLALVMIVGPASTPAISLYALGRSLPIPLPLGLGSGRGGVFLAPRRVTLPSGGPTGGGDHSRVPRVFLRAMGGGLGGGEGGLREVKASSTSESTISPGDNDLDLREVLARTAGGEGDLESCGWAKGPWLSGEEPRGDTRPECSDLSSS